MRFVERYYFTGRNIGIYLWELYYLYMVYNKEELKGKLVIIFFRFYFVVLFIF